jgi:hypothetical protein
MANHYNIENPLFKPKGTIIQPTSIPIIELHPLLNLFSHAKTWQTCGKTR